MIATRWLLACACFAGQIALAGEQRYEPLAASVQASLSSAVADRASPRLVFTTPEEGQAWLAEMSSRMKRYIPEEQMRLDFLTTVQYESKRAGLDPQLVLGVIDTESKFRKHAVSRAGARGYMQVMPFWTGLIGTTEQNLFNLRTNLRYGCVILRHYLTSSAATCSALWLAITAASARRAPTPTTSCTLTACAGPALARGHNKRVRSRYATSGNRKAADSKSVAIDRPKHRYQPRSSL